LLAALAAAACNGNLVTGQQYLASALAAAKKAAWRKASKWQMAIKLAWHASGWRREREAKNEEMKLAWRRRRGGVTTSGGEINHRRQR